MQDSTKFKAFYRVIQPRPELATMTDSQNSGDGGLSANYTFYQRLVQGSANRISRYREFDLADNDVEISRSLDTIAEEMSGNETDEGLPTELVFAPQPMGKGPSAQTIALIEKAHAKWCEFHDLSTRIFYINRTTIKYGDCFFMRNSKTSKWEFLSPKNVIAAIVDSTDVNKIVGWQIMKDASSPISTPGNNQFGPNVATYKGFRENETQNVMAEDIVWFSLNNDMSDSAPFGESVLRAVYKAQKQKELIEDSVIIYRISRAPERRVFYVDVGKMPPNRVKAHLEQMKNEMRQRKNPSDFGGGGGSVDSSYNPMSTNEDIFLATRAGGGTKVDTLPGGASTGVIDDLEYFQWKVYRGLRIPLSYMKEGADNAQVNDGANAYVAELRFSLYVSRLQKQINKTLNAEFRQFLKAVGIVANDIDFRVKLPDPENFGVYRRLRLDTELLNTASLADGIEVISKRMLLEKYLQFDETEIKINERYKLMELGIDPDSPEADVRLVYGSVGGSADEGSMIAGGFTDDLGSTGDDFDDGTDSDQDDEI